MEIQNIYSQLSSPELVKVIKRQKSTLLERHFAKKFSEKREDKQKKKKKGYSLLLTEDNNDLVEISEKNYGNKRHIKNMDSGRFKKKDNGEVIDIKV